MGFGGLRCPGEPMALGWAGVVWAKAEFLVRSPETGKPSESLMRIGPPRWSGPYTRYTSDRSIRISSCSIRGAFLSTDFSS